MLIVEGCFETALSSEWREQVLDGRYFQKYNSYDNFFGLFENVQNLMEIP